MAEFKTDAEGNFIKVEGLDDSEQELDDRPITEVHAGGDSPVMVDAEKRKLEDRDKDEGGGEGGGGVEMGDAGVKKQKISIGFNKTFGAAKTVHEKKSPAPITIKLGTQKTKDTRSTLKKTSASVASAFNQDSDEEEEMPPEAKMRMRNIGRDTPTSAGPNSFGKTRQGFCDAKKVFERQLKKKMEEVSDK